MIRQSGGWIALTVVVFHLIFGANTSAQVGCQPNVLFLFSDDQRADGVGAMGNSFVRTPAIDRLAAEGTLFTRAYCMGGTQPTVCAPSRAMLMSGRTLFRIKENLQGMQTWPEAFGSAGYDTYITGKWHNAPTARFSGPFVTIGGS